MKTSLLLMVTGIVLCILCICQIRYLPTGRNVAKSTSIKTTTSKEVRETITFILGEDKDQKNRYYHAAGLYYTNNTDDRTDYVVYSCRTLSDVLVYLNKYQSCNTKPWALINLVSHGNQWNGLSMKITHNSKRASSKSIAEAINENKLPRLSHGILDSETTIVIHGCGVGNDVELLASVGEVFASESAIPVVNASKFFESYASSFDVQGQRHERYLTRSWMLTYPMDNAPQIQTLANAFRDKYSSSEIDWTGALNRLKPRWPGDEYTFTFEVPVKFTIPLQDESFSFNTLGDKMKFLSECPEVIDALKEIDMCTEDFSWSFSPAYITNKDGQRLSAVWIKGYATVHTVLKDIVASSNSEEVASIKPFSAQLSDPRYYASSSQKSN